MKYASAKGTCQVKRSPPKYEVDKTSHLAVNLAYEQFNSTCKYYRSCKGLRKRCYLIIAACKKTTARLNSGTHAKVYLNAHHNEQYRTRANGEREWFMVATRRTGLTVCYASFNCCIYRIGCAYYFDYRFSAAKSHNILKSYFYILCNCTRQEVKLVTTDRQMSLIFCFMEDGKVFETKTQIQICYGASNKSRQTLAINSCSG